VDGGGDGASELFGRDRGGFRDDECLEIGKLAEWGVNDKGVDGPAALLFDIADNAHNFPP
jgi:hypothetical protein